MSNFDYRPELENYYNQTCQPPKPTTPAKRTQPPPKVDQTRNDVNRGVFHEIEMT